MNANFYPYEGGVAIAAEENDIQDGFEQSLQTAACAPQERDDGKEPESPGCM